MSSFLTQLNIKAAKDANIPTNIPNNKEIEEHKKNLKQNPYIQNQENQESHAKNLDIKNPEKFNNLTPKPTS